MSQRSTADIFTAVGFFSTFVSVFIPMIVAWAARQHLPAEIMKKFFFKRKAGEGQFRSGEEKIGKHQTRVCGECRYLFRKKTLYPTCRNMDEETDMHRLTKLWKHRPHLMPMVNSPHGRGTSLSLFPAYNEKCDCRNCYRRGENAAPHAGTYLSSMTWPVVDSTVNARAAGAVVFYLQRVSI